MLLNVNKFHKYSLHQRHCRYSPCDCLDSVSIFSVSNQKIGSFHLLIQNRYICINKDFARPETNRFVEIKRQNQIEYPGRDYHHINHLNLYLTEANQCFLSMVTQMASSK